MNFIPEDAGARARARVAVSRIIGRSDGAARAVAHVVAITANYRRVNKPRRQSRWGNVPASARGNFTRSACCCHERS